MKASTLLLSLGIGLFASALVFSSTALRPASVAASLSAALPAPAPGAPGTGIERLDPALDAIVARGATVERIATGFVWTEGPVWTRSGFLLFADIPNNRIMKWTPATGRTTTFLEPSGYQGKPPYGGRESGSNGMTLDRRGRLTVAGHARRDIYRLESLRPHARLTVLADRYQGKRLNSPNDLVYRSDGSLYFTDPPYGLRTQNDHDPEKELSFNGVYRLPNATRHAPGAPADNAHLQLLIKDLPRPNGIAFSPDEKYLYVDNSEPQKIWMRYPVKADGTLGPGKLFYDATSDSRPGAPDGMKLDTNGNIFSAGPGGIVILSPAGRHLGTIHFPNRVANCAWGDDGHTLYVTATDSVYRVRLKAHGTKP
jgi:gluconolactonase